MNKPQMPQMTPDQWESLATAVDALSSALAAVRPLAEWEIGPLNAATPEPDPWPTEPLIVADRGGRVNRRGLFARWQTDEDYVDIAGVTSDDMYDLATRTLDTLTNVVPVTVVPTAEWDALVEKVRGFDAARTDNQWRVVTARAAELLIAATDALGVDL